MSEAIPYKNDPERGLWMIGTAEAGVWEVVQFHGLVQISLAGDGGIAAIMIAADHPGDSLVRAVLNTPTEPTI